MARLDICLDYTKIMASLDIVFMFRLHQEYGKPRPLYLCLDYIKSMASLDNVFMFRLHQEYG